MSSAAHSSNAAVMCGRPVVDYFVIYWIISRRNFTTRHLQRVVDYQLGH